jgi:hypothetical protein
MEFLSKHREAKDLVNCSKVSTVLKEVISRGFPLPDWPLQILKSNIDLQLYTSAPLPVPGGASGSNVVTTMPQVFGNSGRNEQLVAA